MDNIDVFIAKTGDFLSAKPYFSFLCEELKSVTSSSLKCQKIALWGFFKNTFERVYGYQPQKDFIYKNEFGKPLSIDEKIYFSVSHTKEVLAIAFSTSPVGIDIEKHKEQVDLDKLIKRVSSNTDAITSLTDFYDLWTKKEAVFKLNGNLSTFIPKNVDINESCLKTFRFKFLLDTYSVSIASKSKFDYYLNLSNDFLKTT